MEIMVGSQALAKFGLQRSKPKDIDLWTDSISDSSLKGSDIHIMPKFIIDIIPIIYNVATPDAVYTIKCSHLAWDIKWEKTKNDILWLKAKGCKLLPELYKILKCHWEKEHGDKSFLSLKQKKEYFFNDNVNYIYDHDYLHELVAYPNPPMYTQCLKENEDVLIDKNKFDRLSFKNKIKLFREEITVIAVERWLVHNRDISWYKAYGLSLKKTITNLTKNWACDFIIHNLEHFVVPKYEYFEHTLKKLNIGNNIMSVDLTPFEELQVRLYDDCETSLEFVVYDLCEGDIYDDEIIEEFGYEHLDQEGGGEGGAEYCYGVFKLKDKIYKAEYSYYSHYGHNYDDILGTLKEVKPIEKLVTVYE